MEPPYIELRSPAGGKLVPLDERPLTVGRHASNRLVLADSEASRYHCVISREAGGWQVKDQNSTNGTKLNGQKVTVALLLGGDVITIGATSLKLVTPAAAPPVEPLPEPVSEPESAEVVETDPIALLTKMAESLPGQSMDDEDIALLGPRGQTMHAAGGAPGRKTPEVARDSVDLFRALLSVCFRGRASDVHVEPKNDDYLVRLRIDGTLVDVVRLDKIRGQRLTTMVKVLCEIDIAKKNIIQEGHFAAMLTGRRVDYRVSFAPAVQGQKLVIRIFDTSNTPLHTTDLGLPSVMLEQIDRAIHAESGMLLSSGPTGSGKTTTLYALVRSIDVGERNVTTIEDPVEIQLDGVTQIPVNEDQGNTFPTLLRSVLRQDPDAILIGEVRDTETARIAMQAAITGHLVFSTIHAKDTIGTIFRLLDLGVEPYMVAQGLHLVLAQRLVRKLCPACRRRGRPTFDQAKRLGDAVAGVTHIFSPVGCPRCLGTGYFGRRAIFELLTTNDELRDVILKTPTMAEIQRCILAGGGFARLSHSGYKLVADGVSSLDEIERVV